MGWVVVSCAPRRVEVREQPVGVGSLIQPCRSWGPVVLAPQHLFAGVRLLTRELVSVQDPVPSSHRSLRRLDCKMGEETECGVPLPDTQSCSLSHQPTTDNTPLSVEPWLGTPPPPPPRTSTLSMSSNHRVGGQDPEKDDPVVLSLALQNHCGL